MSATLLIRHGRLVDPANGVDAALDVLVRDGAVTRIGKSLKPPEGAEVVDATGLVVCPGMIDIHVHLRVGCRTSVGARPWSSPAARLHDGISPA